MPNEVEYTDLTPVYFRKGDRLFGLSHEFIGTVDRVDRKKVNGTVHFQESDVSPETVRLAQGFTVLREEETPEEAEARNRNYALDALQRAIDAAPEKVQAAKDLVVKRVVEDGWRELDAVSDLVAAKIDSALWGRVAKVAERMDLIEAARLVAEDETRKLMEYGFRTVSVSTSEVSNLESKIETEAKLAWLRDLRWKTM